MPIHDQSYRHWEGNLKSHTFRWWAIAFEGLKVVLRRKLFVILILIPAIIQFFVFGGLIYGVNTYGVFANFNLINPEFFFRFCFQQTFFILMICVFAGSGLIANDLKSNALQLYLSKPLTRFDYIAGKSATILIMLECITFIPGILLFLEHSALSQESTFIREQYWLLGSIFLFSLILNVPITFLTLALSSITKNNRYSAIVLMAIIIGTPILGGLLKVVFRANWANYIQYWYNINALGKYIFGLQGGSTASLPINPVGTSSTGGVTSWHWSALIMIILTAVSIWIMYRKIKGVEIVK